MDRVAAGHGVDDLRDQSLAAGRAAEHSDEEAHRMGSRDRGADRGHRLLRAERSLPGLRQTLGIRAQPGDHRRDCRHPVRRAQAAGLDLADSNSTSATTGRWSLAIRTSAEAMAWLRRTAAPVPTKTAS